MGVRGLSTYVEENYRRFYERKKLNNCSIVIDGYGLLYHLYYSCEIDSRLGGEYDVLVSTIKMFFNQLKQCEITAYVMFDGPLSEDKLSCALQRMRDKVREVCAMFTYGQSSEGRKKYLPLFAIHVFHHTLNELHIPYMVALNDADSEIAALANHVGCYVLAQDSDFFIFHLQHGYLPLMHFYWEEVFNDGQHGSHIMCQSYHIQSMTQQFGISESALPWLSILLGNDWIPQEMFNQFVLKLLTKKSSSSKKEKKKKKKYCGKVGTVLTWLSSQYQNDDLMINKLQQNQSKKNRQRETSNIQKCLDLYRVLPDMIENAKFMIRTRPALGVEDGHEIQATRADDLVRIGSLPPLVCDVTNLQLVLLPVIPSDPRKPSPHVSAQRIRSVIYEVILRKFSDSREATMIQEYDKVGSTYKKSCCVEPVVTICPVCEDENEGPRCPCLQNAYKITDEVFGSLVKGILEVEDINVKQWCDKLFAICVAKSNDQVDFEVLLFSVLYWVRYSAPAPAIICTLLTVIAWSMNCYSYNSSNEELNEFSDSSENAEHVSIHTVDHKSSLAHSQNLCKGSTFKEKDARICSNGEHKESYNTSNSKKEFNAVELLDAISPASVSAAGYTEKDNEDVDLDLLHSASEWQCILHSILLLKQIMQPGKPSFAVNGILNSNALLQKVLVRIKRETRHKISRNLRLLGAHLAGNLQLLSDEMTSLFRVFIDFISQHAQQ